MAEGFVRRSGISPITHQQIADRRVALVAERAAIKKRIEEESVSHIVRELASLRELCAGIGHVFVADPFAMGMSRARQCASCGCFEQSTPAAQVEG